MDGRRALGSMKGSTGSMSNNYDLVRNFEAAGSGQPAFDQLDLGEPGVGIGNSVSDPYGTAAFGGGDQPSSGLLSPSSFFPASGSFQPLPPPHQQQSRPQSRVSGRAMSPPVVRSVTPTPGGSAGPFGTTSGGFLGFDQHFDMRMSTDDSLMRGAGDASSAFGSAVGGGGLASDTGRPLLAQSGSGLGFDDDPFGGGLQKQQQQQQQQEQQQQQQQMQQLAAAESAAALSAAAAAAAYDGDTMDQAADETTPAPAPSLSSGTAMAVAAAAAAASAATTAVAAASSSGGRSRRSTKKAGATAPSKMKTSLSSSLSSSASTASTASAAGFTANQRRHQTSPAAAILKDLENKHRQQAAQLDKIRPMQRQVLMATGSEAYAVLTAEQLELCKSLDEQLSALAELPRTYVMPASELATCDHLSAQLTIQRVQVQLFQEELAEWHKQTSGAGGRRGGAAAAAAAAPKITPRARLCILQHPFPMVVTKGKVAESHDAVVVQLVTGAAASCDFTRYSAVSAVVVADDSSSSGKSAPPAKILSSEQFTFDSASRTGQFKFKCTGGTRKLPVSMRFTMKATRPDGQTCTAESELVPPLIVITNECQFDESACVLMRAELFPAQTAAADGSNVTECRWPLFANRLQQTFTRGTRQNVEEPHRALSAGELAYIQNKWFGGAQKVTVAQFDQFWANWFGRVLQKMRYQRYVTPMWRDGLIYGLIERHQIHEMLAQQPVGASLIRFSERHPGLFAVGYRIDEEDYDNCVRHYLITPGDTDQKKTLADFLGESEQFATLCQLTGAVDKNGVPRCRFIPKDVVLHQYYAKPQQSNEKISGYDTTLKKPDASAHASSSGRKKKRK